MRFEILYCAPCGYLARAEALLAAIERALADREGDACAIRTAAESER